MGTLGNWSSAAASVPRPRHVSNRSGRLSPSCFAPHPAVGDPSRSRSLARRRNIGLEPVPSRAGSSVGRGSQAPAPCSGPGCSSREPIPLSTIIPGAEHSDRWGDLNAPAVFPILSPWSPAIEEPAERTTGRKPSIFHPPPRRSTATRSSLRFAAVETTDARARNEASESSEINRRSPRRAGLDEHDSRERRSTKTVVPKSAAGGSDRACIQRDACHPIPTRIVPVTGS